MSSQISLLEIIESEGKGTAPAPATKETAVAGVAGYENPFMPYDYEMHKEVRKALRNGELTLDGYRAAWDAAKRSKSVLEKVFKKMTIKQLKPIANSYHARKKAEYVEEAVNSVLDFFTAPHKSNFIAWTHGQETREEAVEKMVLEVTAEDLAAYAAKIAEHAAAVVQQLTDPQTLQDFNKFRHVRGDDAMSYEQWVRYDSLVYASQQEEVKRLRYLSSHVEKLDIGTELTVEKSWHDKKEVDIWLVKLGERIPRDEFREARQKASRWGGYYSRYSGAFVFWNEEDAAGFAGLQDGDGDITARLERIAERKAERAADRLQQYATRNIDAASRDMNRERLTNTVRRVRMARSAIADAAYEKAIGETVEAIANSMEDGTAGALQGVQYVTQIVDLYKLLRTAWGDACTAENGRYTPLEARRKIRRSDIMYAKFPKPFVNRDTVEKLLRDVKGRKGTRGKSSVLQALIDKAKQEDHHHFRVMNARVADTVLELVALCRIKRVKDDMYAAFATYKRLKALGIINVYTLRHTLREFLEYAIPPQQRNAIQEAEWDLVGKRIDGFVPTPAELADAMVARAELANGMFVWEPEAGSGNICEAVRRYGVDVELEACEVSYELRNLLKMKGIPVVGFDMLEHTPERPYDAILMNPPFEDGQDIKHIMHAYKQLKEGGVLVAIAGEGAFGSRKPCVTFKGWLDALGADIEKLPRDTFYESGTTVASRLITIWKE